MAELPDSCMMICLTLGAAILAPTTLFADLTWCSVTNERGSLNHQRLKTLVLVAVNGSLGRSMCTVA